MQTVVIGKNQAGQRLDKFLRKFMPEAGSGFLYKMLRKKNITLNEKKASGSEILAPGDRLSMFFSPETFEKMTGSAQAKEGNAAAEYVNAYRALSGSGIAVLYEDRDILVAGKPAGILSQKADASDVTLNEWLIGYLLEKKAFPEEELGTFKPSVCNRLDRNTSGIVFCGKSLAGVQHLAKLLRERQIRKLYRTICVGEISRELALRGHLTKDEARNMVTVTGSRAQGSVSSGKLSVQKVGKQPGFGAAGELRGSGTAMKADGKNAGAYVETICRPLAVSMGYTLLEVELVTGKTHQIRAQLAEAEHPLIGDFKYGDGKTNRLFREAYGLDFQLLHAYEAEFLALGADDGQRRSVCAPYPEIFKKILRELRFPLKNREW